MNAPSTGTKIIAAVSGLMLTAALTSCGQSAARNSAEPAGFAALVGADSPDDSLYDGIREVCKITKSDSCQTG